LLTLNIFILPPALILLFSLIMPLLAIPRHRRPQPSPSELRAPSLPTNRHLLRILIYWDLNQTLTGRGEWQMCWQHWTGLGELFSRNIDNFILEKLDFRAFCDLLVCNNGFQ
jgi:hypothetical protein